MPGRARSEVAELKWARVHGKVTYPGTVDNLEPFEWISPLN